MTKSFASAFNRYISIKVIGAIVLAVLLVVPLMAYISVSQVRDALENSYLDKSRTTARLLDASIREFSDLEDTNALFEILQRHRWLEPDINRIDLYLIREGKLQIAVSTESNRSGLMSDAKNRQAYIEDHLHHETTVGENSRLLRLITPIHIARRQVGTFQLEMSLDEVDKKVLATLSSLIFGYIITVTTVALLGFLLIRRIVITPLKTLERGMESMATGTLETPLKVNTLDELGRLTRTFNKMGSDLQKSNAKVRHLAFHDALTELPNRRVLQDRLDQELARCLRENCLGILLFIDIDHFKDINDTLGHSVGDQLLCRLASRLQQQVRATDTIARQGGDEFVIMLRGADTQSIEATTQAAEKLLASLKGIYSIDGHQIHITISAGLCVFPEFGEDSETVIKNADAAMYFAKYNGRNQVCNFAQELEVQLNYEMTLRQDLQLAIQENQFHLVYQAQCDQHGYIKGIEALIRWQHPQKGLILPGQFISLAEKSDLICHIGEWVLQRAFSEFSTWISNESVDPIVALSVNVSPSQFHAKNFTQAIRNVSTETGMDLNRLVLEVTEGALMVDPDNVAQKMLTLSKEGVRFSLDDFGTGYSSFGYLKRLPVSCLKVDRAFVKDVCNSEDDAAIAKAIITMGGQYELDVIIEGVETVEQLRFFLQYGCDTYQGYLFHRPETLDGLMDTLRLRLTDASSLPPGAQHENTLQN